MINASGAVINGSAPAQSQTTSQGTSIYLNLNFGWMNPTSLTVYLGYGSGGTAVVNFVAQQGAAIGAPGLTTSQYYELVILHELGHLLGVPQEASQTYNQSIFNDCIKGH
jgi:hypothetical protein